MFTSPLSEKRRMLEKCYCYQMQKIGELLRNTEKQCSILEDKGMFTSEREGSSKAFIFCGKSLSTQVYSLRFAFMLYNIIEYNIAQKICYRIIIESYKVQIEIYFRFCFCFFFLRIALRIYLPFGAGGRARKVKLKDLSNSCE